LTRLRIRGCDVTGDGFAHIAGNKELNRFELRDSSIDNDGLVILSKLPKVTYLDISECRLPKPEGLKQIGKLTGLTYLGLWDTKTDDEVVKSFETLVNLETLDLKATKITDAAVPSLMKLTKLVDLSIVGTTLSEESIRTLATLPNLKVLVVANTGLTSDAAKEIRSKHKPLDVKETES
jgi:internalin A